MDTPRALGKPPRGELRNVSQRARRADKYVVEFKLGGHRAVPGPSLPPAFVGRREFAPVRIAGNARGATTLRRFPNRF
jgi:hypothetical protein